MGAFCGEPIDYDGEVELRQFELLRSVRIVQRKNTRQVYALKYINKQKCIKMKAVHNIIQERRLLEDISFPLIVNLRYAFQDDENLFMILDLMLGGDLRFHLDRLGSLKEEQVRFFVAEIALSLNHLHLRRIVHRDLKPDNVLLDDNGHAHLTDFNIAVRYTEGNMLKTVAGSMAYMAPEVLKKEGYYSSPDWWSLGVIMYELLFGKRPFRAKTNDGLTQAIMTEKLSFPHKVEQTVSKEALDLMKGLIERDITKRLGYGPAKWDEFRNHEFFKLTINGEGPIDWDALAKKTGKGPFIPDAKKANFDASHELEELLLEENPLRVKKRAQNRDYSKYPGGESGETAQMMMIMEKKFTSFNHEKKNAPGAMSPKPKAAERMSLQMDSVAKSNTSSRDKMGEHSMMDLGNIAKDESEESVPPVPTTPSSAIKDDTTEESAQLKRLSQASNEPENINLTVEATAQSK